MAPKNRWNEHPGDLLRVDEDFSLEDVVPHATPGWRGTKRQGKDFGKARGPLLSELQERLYAHGRTGGSRSVLLIVQGMDLAFRTSRGAFVPPSSSGIKRCRRGGGRRVGRAGVLGVR